MYLSAGLGIQFVWHFKVTLGQIQSTWSFHARWSQISHTSSISMGFDCLLQSPCSVLLFHYLVRKFILVAEPIVVKQRRHWYKQFIMVTHTHVLLVYILVELLRPPYWLNLAFLSRSIKFGGAIHMTLLTKIGYGYTGTAPCG